MSYTSTENIFKDGHPARHHYPKVTANKKQQTRCKMPGSTNGQKKKKVSEPCVEPTASSVVEPATSSIDDASP
jgi:hypothetical protein